MTINERINEALQKDESRHVKLYLTVEEKEVVDKLIKEGKLSKKLFFSNKICIIETGKDFIRISTINTRSFKNEIFDTFIEFFTDEKKETTFNFPEDVKDIIENHKEIIPYIDIVREDVKKMLNNRQYRGFVTEVIDKDNGFVISKNFIANYEVLIFNKNNKPYVKIKKISSSKNATLYTPNMKNYSRIDEDTIICLYKNLDRLLEINDIKDNEIVINKDSIEQFYVFDNICFVNPTKKWVNMWWNYDCPQLYRYMPNIKGTTNMWGLCLICWQNLLIESSWSCTHIEEDITEEEIEAFGGDYKHTAIYGQMQRVLKARNMAEEEKQEKIKEAEKIEKEIQEIINEHKEEIIFSTLNNFKSYCEFDIEKVKTLDEEGIRNLFRKIDSQMGLDCGFICFKLKEGDELFKEIAEYDRKNYRTKDGALRLRLPIFVQSTTIQRKMAEHVKDVVENNSNYKLTYWTELD